MTILGGSKVILSHRDTFGGTRVDGGQVAVDLWSDGVVLGTAWTFSPESIVAGELFTFRGTLTKVTWAPRSQTWRLLDTDGRFVGAYGTRAAALVKVARLVTMDAFRELNRIERDR